jgi:hypothetical protein
LRADEPYLREDARHDRRPVEARNGRCTSHGIPQHGSSERERVASFKGAFFASTQVATWELKAVLRVFRLDGAAVLRPNGPFLAH